MRNYLKKTRGGEIDFLQEDAKNIVELFADIIKKDYKINPNT